MRHVRAGAQILSISYFFLVSSKINLVGSRLIVTSLLVLANFHFYPQMPSCFRSSRICLVQEQKRLVTRCYGNYLFTLLQSELLGQREVSLSNSFNTKPVLDYSNFCSLFSLSSIAYNGKNGMIRLKPDKKIAVNKFHQNDVF